VFKVFSESPSGRNDDLLSSWELVLTSSEGFHWVSDAGFLNSDWEKNRADLDTSSLSVWLTPSTSHTSLETICSGTGKHLIDSESVPWVDTTSQVEVIFTDLLDQVLVDWNSASFKSFRRNLFFFIWDQVDDSLDKKFKKIFLYGEVINGGLLSTCIVNLNLGVRDTSVISGFWEGFTVGNSVTSSWSSAHF
jgi:hypothetical protein